MLGAQKAGLLATEGDDHDWPHRRESALKLGGDFDEHSHTRGVIVGTGKRNSALIKPEVIVVRPEHNRLVCEHWIAAGDQANDIAKLLRAAVRQRVVPRLQIGAADCL